MLYRQHLCQILPKSVDVRWSYSVQHQCRFLRHKSSRTLCMLQCHVCWLTEASITRQSYITPPQQLRRPLLISLTWPAVLTTAVLDYTHLLVALTTASLWRHQQRTSWCSNSSSSSVVNVVFFSLRLRSMSSRDISDANVTCLRRNVNTWHRSSDFLPHR